LKQFNRNAWWSAKQGLNGSLQGAAPATVLTRTGWSRSVGGVGPYLTLFARAGTGREAADQAVTDLQIHELPSARGCTYVVPADDFALALKVGQPFAEVPLNTARKYLGVTDQELDNLCDAVRGALRANGPLNPTHLKDRCGGAVRNLGDAGKKRGLTTTLPLALGYLQATGEIRRVPENGRLDQQRYAYTYWTPNPLDSFTLSLDEAHMELARRYFRWIGPATLAEFQWFSGLGVGAAKKAIAPLNLVPVDDAEPFLILPDEADAYAAFTPPDQPQLSLVTSFDSMLLLRRNLSDLLDPADRERAIWGEKGLHTAGSLADSPFHVILDRGRLIGFWEYDLEREQIAWMTFNSPPAGLPAVIAQMETYAREQLGDLRSHSMDTVASRAPKIAWLRQQS